MKCTFTIAVVDKEGNEQGKFTVRKGCIGEGIQIIDFKGEDCVSGNELTIHLFLEDFENNKGQLYQIYVDSLTIDYEIN